VSLRVVISASRTIPAPPAAVWRAFCRLAAWPPPPGGAVLLPLGRRERVPVEEVAWRPGQWAAWRGRWRGVAVRQRVVFRPVGRGTLVEWREELEGWALIWWRLCYSPRRLGRGVQAWLSALAAAAEDEAGEPSAGRRSQPSSRGWIQEAARPMRPDTR